MKQTHSITIKIKIITLCLLLTMVLPLVTACQSRAIPADKLALTPVGTVDGRTVYYEELYFLATNYLPTLENKHGDNREALVAELDLTVREHIVANYAMLRLCENEGLTYDEKDKELKKAAQEYVDLLIENQFDGSRRDYRREIATIGMTDHYLRFTARVDALYDKLPTLYGEKGLLPTEDEAIRTYVNNHFIRTWHIAILVEDGESYEENRAKAEEALAKLQSGTSMYKMIGSKYNEDFSLTTTDGYYFSRGTMDEQYEAAAFSLEIGQTGGIVETVGISNKTGNNVPCFYIIERLPIEEDYVNSHLTDLADKCADAIIATKLEEVSDTLEFIPNDYYRSLDLTALDAPSDGVDLPLILTIGGIVLAVAGATTAIILIVRRKKKSQALIRK